MLAVATECAATVISECEMQMLDNSLLFMGIEEGPAWLLLLQ